MDLSSCRYYEGGEIPWTALKAYADEYELDEVQRSMLYQIIRTVDMWFLDELRKRAEQKNGGSKSKRGHEGGQRKILSAGKGV